MANETTQKLWTPANKVTLARILAIPVFLAVIIAPWPEYLPDWPHAESWKPLIAAIVFIVISATDAVDGHLARSRGEVTTLGKFMDPLADKLLVTAALLVLVELRVLPSWVALIIISREFIVSGIRMVAASEGVVIAASWWGKIKTVTQIVAIVLFLVKGTPLLGDFDQNFSDGMYVLAWAAMILAVFFTIVSMLDYFRKAADLLGFTKRAKRADVEPFDYMRMSDDSWEREYPTKGDLEEMARSVIDSARAAGKKLGTAESCTGGLIGATLTDIAGSSDVVEGGIVSYSNDVKMARLGVPEQVLSEHGAVSEQTACAMAQGAREQLGVDIAVSVTGIAGPGGAVPGKPVGTVWIGVSDAAGTQAHLFTFGGSRSQVRSQAVRESLRLFSERIGA
ncbi:MAG: CDP-diacylglycerol--glycerol-3-phosphate 3-phosphatidyltransferase [Coriobacteriaceae bacterium]|nr:CDP-diacylglycerol--glycerol-3-phosphate 3-phosphatidyltransferase [Coriobacteriaceae bacterium]